MVLISSIIQSKFKSCIDGLAALGSSIDVEESCLDSEQFATLVVPTARISRHELPVQQQPSCTLSLQAQTDQSSSPEGNSLSPQATSKELVSKTERTATQATGVQRWSQPTFFQISLDTVLEELDDAPSQPTSSRSSFSSKSSCSERNVTPSPIQETYTDVHHDFVEIMSDVTDSYIQNVYFGGIESKSHDAISDVKFSPSYGGFQPDFDQYSPSFQLKKMKEMRPKTQIMPSAQPTLINECLIDTNTQTSLSSFDSPNHSIGHGRSQSPGPMDTPTELDWFENELAVADQNLSLVYCPKVHPASAHPVECTTTPFVLPRTKYMSIAQCNNQGRSKSLPLPAFHPTPHQRPDSLPTITIKSPMTPMDKTQTRPPNSQFLNSTSKLPRCQSTDLAHLPLRNNLFSQSVPDLHSSNTPSKRISVSRAPTLPLSYLLPSWVTTNSVDDTTQDVHVANSKPVFMESSRGLRISLQPPPTTTMRTRNSFQRLSSMFHKPKQADSFFDFSD